MRVVVPWLRELVDIPVGVEPLAETLALRGFEVAEISRAPAQRRALDPSSGREVDFSADVIDFEITANRPDCLALVGIAREVSAAFDRPLLDRAPPSVPRAAVDAEANVAVEIEDVERCPRYAAQLARVRVGPSPEWLAGRLQAANVRPINNIVDVTNYLMIETGQPMHAFDLARLTGREIRVRTARPGERIWTLDGQERTLAPDMLVIADAQRAQAVAGVMGGADSEVGPLTRVVLFESAYFQPTSVRRTSRRLGLKTEASARFERGADPSIPAAALERLCALLVRIGAGEPVGPIVDRYPEPCQPRRLLLRRARIAHLLGHPVWDADVVRILERLGFAVAPGPEGWEVTVPTFRVDVAREADLIEEVARHTGYDRVPATFPALDRLQSKPDPRITRDHLARRVLGASGFDEAVTFAFVERQAAEAFVAGADELVPIANPLSEMFAVLRPTLLASLLDSVGHNRRREHKDVRLFETGARFARSEGERRAVGFVWMGTASSNHWSVRPRAVDFFDVKGVVEALCDAFGVAPHFEPTTRPYLVTGQAAAVHVADRASEPIGVVGQLAPPVAAARGLTGADDIFVGELDLDRLEDLARPRDHVRVEPLPRHPSIVRDVSIVVEAGLPAAAVRGTIRGAAPASLVSMREFDRYRGQGVPEGRVSLSYRLTFRLPDRTLTDAEVDRAMDAIVARLKEHHGAQQR